MTSALHGDSKSASLAVRLAAFGVVAVCLLCPPWLGCSGYSLEALADAPTGAPADAGLGGAPADELTPLAAFGPPTLISALSDPGLDRDATVTGDRLELYFSSNRMAGIEHIFRSLRPSPRAAWGPPTFVAEVNEFQAWSPDIAPDGLTLWLVSDRPGSMAEDIWVTTRTSRSEPFQPPSLVENVNGPSADVGPNVDESGHSMYFSSDRLGSQGSDLYLSSRSSVNGSWGAPVRIDELASRGNDWDPFIAKGGLALFFVIDMDIVVAERPSTVAVFAKAMPVANINTSSQETDPTLSPDLRHLIFSSDRSGNRELYEAWR